MSLDRDIKCWYVSAYPCDAEGETLFYNRTFRELNRQLPNVYEYTGCLDSLVRERIFNELARLLNVNYNDVYKRWLMVV